MGSHHKSKLKISNAPYKKSIPLTNEDREIRMGELRLNYVQLTRDANSFLGDEDAFILIKDSKANGTKLVIQKG